MSKRPTLSACLVVYNEEKVIARCLDSVKDIADEIIVVHDGECSDKTMEIAKRYTDKLYVRPHIGIAEGHRIFYLEEMTGDWLLQLDADEFLSPELAKAIPGLIADASVDAYEVVWPLWNGREATTTNWPFKPILFRKSKLTYLDFPQEPLRTTGTLKRVNLVLEHQPTYDNYTWKRFRTKWLAWTKLQAKETLKPFADIPKFQVQDTDWPPKFRLARDHSYLFLFIGMYLGLLSLVGGSWREGWPAMKQSLMWGAYNAVVYYYVTVLRVRRFFHLTDPF